MYAIHKEVHPPTGVEHCLYSQFISPFEYNLIVAGVNQLFIYKLNSEIELSSKGVERTPDISKVKKCRLELLTQFQLHGNVVSMKNVRLAGNNRDSLLLSFSEAKLALLDYDPCTHDLKTSSLHYFEEESMKDGLVQHKHDLPQVCVDPEGRCAVMLIYGNKLVVLPFRKEVAAEEEVSTAGKGAVMSSYIIDLRHLDEKITNIIDMQFLFGYYEPTLFILYEPLPTWAGRVAVRKDTCSIVALSLNIQEKVHPIIWSLSNLSFDCLKVIPIPKPIGGVLLFAVNSLIYMNQSVPPYGVSLNSCTEFSTEFLLKKQEGVRMTLDSAQATMISGDKMVISLKGGELYVLTLCVDGMRAVRSFNFDKAAASVLTSCICQCKDGYIFLGSRLGNSLLLKYTEKDVAETSSEVKQGKLDEPSAKKKKVPTATLR